VGIASEPGQLLSRFAKVCQGVAQWWGVMFSFFWVLNSAESRGVSFMEFVYFFVGHHVRFQVEISEMWTFQNKKTWRIPEAG